MSLQAMQEDTLRQASAASQDDGGSPPARPLSAAEAMGASMNEVQKSITDAHDLLDAVSIDKDGTAIPEIQELKRR